MKEMPHKARKRTEYLLKRDIADSIVTHQLKRYSPNDKMYRPTVENLDYSANALRATIGHRENYVKVVDMHVDDSIIERVEETFGIEVSNVTTVLELVKIIQEESPVKGKFLQSFETDGY